MAESLTTRKREIDSEYTPHPIGTPGRPWPTRLRGEDNGVRTFGMGVIQSKTDPLWLHSTRKYKHILPELMRNMPSPCMFDSFEAILNNPLVHIVSDPAYGKSYIANLIGNAMHHEGAVMYDAGGKNMESLLFETVFDSNANSDLIDRINSALRDNTLTAPSLKALRELKENKGLDQTKSLLSEEGNKKVFDWKGLEGSNITRKEIDDVLSSVQKYQEWNGGLRIGFKDVDGALIRAAKEHRPLVIDEALRRKVGSEAALQQVWQVINGEINQLTIPLGNLGEFKLHHGDIPKVIMTSNYPKDGADVHQFSDSLRSRLVEKEIPDFTQEDWAHRISQVLTGVPITTLTRLEKGHMLQGSNPEDAQWEIADHNKFRQNLESIRHANETAVPRLQTKLLDHWQDVIAVSNALGRAYHESSALLDPESPVLQQTDMASIRFEVDKPGDKAQKLTPRTALRSLRQAIQRMPESVPATQTQGADFSNWDMPNITPSKEPIEAKMGDRMKTLIEHWIDDIAGVTPDGAKRPRLYAQLRKVWEEAGVIGQDSVLDKLNIKSTAVEATTDEVTQAQAVINNYLKAKYSGFEGVSVQQVEIFLKGLQEIPPKILGDEKVQAHVLTSTADSIADGAFTDAVAAVSRTADQSKPEAANFSDFIAQHPPEKLVDQDKVISTLALPYIGKELLQSISKTPDGVNFKPAASYSNNMPYVITTTIAKSSENGTDSYAKLHVVHNKQTGKSLVVAFTEPTVGMDSYSSVTVVNAKDRNAALQVNSWLDKNSPVTSDELLAGFQERNTVPTDKTNTSLGALLTDITIKTFSPTMLDGSHSTSRSM